MPTSKHREKQIEARIVKRAKEHGGIAFKFTSQGRRSVPDRLLVVPCVEQGTFVEAKAPGQKPTGSQLREHERIRQAGGTVYVTDTYESVDFLFDTICDGSCQSADDSSQVQP